MESTTAAETLVLTHRWESKGYAAPYRYVGAFSFPTPSMIGNGIGGADNYNRACAECAQTAKALGVSGGCCDICGMSLLNNYVCQDAKGVRFVVGCDCVAKIGDTKLVTAVEKAERARRRQMAADRRTARIQARVAAIAAKDEEERQRNGGKTDRELVQDARRREEASKAASVTAANQWILDGLGRGPDGGFVENMRADLARRLASDLSERCLSILADIWSKNTTGKSRGKVVDEARETFFANLEPAA